MTPNMYSNNCHKTNNVRATMLVAIQAQHASCSFIVKLQSLASVQRYLVTSKKSDFGFLENL